MEKIANIDKMKPLIISCEYNHSRHKILKNYIDKIQNTEIKQ